MGKRWGLSIRAQINQTVIVVGFFLKKDFLFLDIRLTEEMKLYRKFLQILHSAPPNVNTLQKHDIGIPK